MQKYNGSLIRQFPNSVTGNSAVGVFVGVFISGTSTPATLYEDDDTGGATLPNPLTTNNVGFYSFYAADGKYRLEFSATQYPDLEVQLLDSNQVVDEFGAGAGLIGQAASAALVSISADVAAVDASRVSGQSAMAADVTAVDNSRINAQNLISLDVAAVDVAATNALAVEIPAQINRLGLQYPPIAYISGLTLDSHVKTYSYDDALYIWGGALGTVTTGDFDETGWQPIQGDVQLRNDVTKGTSLIRDVKHLSGIFELGVVVPQYDGQQFSVAGFYIGTVIGGGVFVWDAARDKADHNGGTVISPEAVAAWDGTQADLATLLNWTGSGSGCYIFKDKAVYPSSFGAISDGSEYDDASLLAHANAVKSSGILCWEPSASYKIKRTLQITISNGISFDGNGAFYFVDSAFEVDSSGNWTPVVRIVGGGNSEHVSVRNLRHYGNNDINQWYTVETNYGLHAVEIRGLSETDKLSSVDVCHLQSDWSGGDVVRVVDASSVIVDSCAAMHTGHHGISTKNCDNIRITKNVISGIGSAGGDIVTGVQGGIGILCTLGSKAVVSDNIISDMTDTCSKTEGVKYVVYSNNIGLRCGKDGFKTQGYEGQDGNVDYAIFEGNIMVDLYDWRTDGASLYQVSNAKNVIFNSNLGESDPSRTGSLKEKNGVKLINLGSGLGSSGFISVTNNIFKKTSPFNDNPGEVLTDGWSISIARNGTAGHTMLVSGNTCYQGVVAGGGFGKTVISSNIVGAADNATEVIKAGNWPAIRAQGSDIVISGNSCSGFGKLIECIQLTPQYGISSISISGNTGRNMGGISEAAGTPSSIIDVLTLRDDEPYEINLGISGNVISDIKLGGREAIRIRPNGNKITAAVTSNTLSGDYRTLISIFERLETDLLLGHFAVSSNSENSTRSDYFVSPLMTNCERVTGDYAQSGNTVPPSTDRKFRRGDVVWNSGVLSGRPTGWMMAIPESQTWVAMPSAITI